MPCSWQYSKKPSGTRGAPSTCTELGPPDRMMVLGCAALMRSCDSGGGCVMRQQVGGGEVGRQRAAGGGRGSKPWAVCRDA